MNLSSRIYMIYDDIVSDDMGVFINWYDVLKPETRENAMKIDNLNGELDFTLNGEEVFESRYIKVECALIAASRENMISRKRAIAAWLSRKAKFSFSDEPDKYYTGRALNAAELTDDDLAGTFELTFKCYEPFAIGKTEIYEAGGVMPLALPLPYPGTHESCCKIIIQNTGNTPINGIELIHTYLRR